MLPHYRRLILDEAHNLEEAATRYMGAMVSRKSLFRVLRSAEITLEEDEASDLLEMISEELRERKFAPVVRVEVEPNATEQDAARCEFARSDVRFTLHLAGARILVRGDDRFCELTHTAITHDKPGVGPVPLDGPASLLWESGSGVLIGRRAAVAGRVEVATGARTGAVVPLAVTVVEDLFVIPQSAVWMTLTFTTPAGPVRAEVDAQAVLARQAVGVGREQDLGERSQFEALGQHLAGLGTHLGDVTIWHVE